MSSLGVVSVHTVRISFYLARLRRSFCSPDGVTSSQTDPLRDGAVLLLRLGELDLCTESLVGLQMR